MRINHNIASLNTYRQLNANSTNGAKSLEKLSSGLRINRAGDDAAGLAISEKMRAQIRGLDQASRNAQDGISMIQTAEGALNETQSILQRMRELADQAANGTNTEADRASIQDEINQLTSEVNRIGNTTEFNTQKLLNGGIGSGDGSKITQATSATKTLSGNIAGATNATVTLGAITDGNIAAATAATIDITIAAAAVGTGGKITVDGVEFDASGITFTGVAAGDEATNKALLENLTATVNGQTVKLSDMADVSVSTVTATITSKTSGGTSKVSSTAGASTGISAETEVQGDGTAIIVNGKTFDLSGITVNNDDDANKAATIAALGAITSSDGTVLSDLVDITFNADADAKLIFTTKGIGTANTIQFESKDEAALGLTASSHSGAGNAVAGTDASANIAAGTKITVNNTTFDLGGVTIDTSDIEGSIEALKNVTSGGTKLGELVDIAIENGQLTFSTKASGANSTIQFTGVDSAIGSTAGDIGAANAVKGKSTTVERSGLEASTALSTTADISIAAGSTFKIAVGTESDVTVALNKGTDAKVYNTNDADANVSKAAMDQLVKDLNTALQEAGLNGKVSVSLSQENKIQFISETGVDIEIKDGTNTPLVSSLGFTNTATDMGVAKNVQQVVGPGAQGSGYNTTFQIGSNKGQTMSLQINDMRAAALGITGNAGQAGFTEENFVTNGTTDVKSEAALNVMNKEDASRSLEVLDTAIAKVSAERGKLGSIQNRLEHTINNLGTAAENLTSAESRVRDVDMAKEMMEFTKNNILSQAAQAMLAQANQQPQGVLQLLR